MRSWDYASNDDRIVVSHDTDFGALLAFRVLTRPSFIQFRSSDPITPDEQAALIISNLDSFADELEGGAIVAFARGRLRIRLLPVR
jgi:predicted nuclease of predicted toxin-antitoxin system